jgi:hypothetical protein
MARKSKLNAGEWWKFSSYEIRDFTRSGVREKYIGPAKGAKLSKYDPWKSWDDTGPLRQDRASPYRELLNTIAKFKCGLPEKRTLGHLPSYQWRNFSEALELASEAALLKWCGKFGLLGLLPHDTYQITLAPNVRNSEEAPTLQKTRVQSQFSRTPKGWVELERPSIDGIGKQFSPTGVLRRDLVRQALTWGSLSNLLDFFPTIPGPDDSDLWKEFQYPLPLSEEFWNFYSEPLSGFLAAAGRLNDAIKAMEIDGPLPKVGSLEHRVLLRGLPYLEGLLDPVSLTYEFIPKKGIRPRHVAGSLLATLATMALNDRPRGKFLQCEKCGNFFPSGAYPQALYCSKQCRWATQRKAQRDRKKKEGNGQ